MFDQVPQINPVPSTGIPGGTSLIGSADALAAAGPMGPPAAAPGFNPGAMGIGLAIQAAQQGIQNSADLMGYIGQNPYLQGQTLSMTPGQAYQEAIDFERGVATEAMGSIPFMSMLGIDKLTGNMAAQMAEGRARERASMIARARRDAESKARLDYQEAMGYGQTYNDIF